ncbi:division/cell wall cluster transcriptional repressor MraZ [Sphingomonas canadensis]|uniref:Transcriptional regulator MraZ n=1 Tax=Sphingomonas canadensis TaxID=1219257 RepID=A0ABW3H4Z4_9SPHN|nr:division/cell wall cluster transcriptional repressor MraZ [Sphingomonas canadensis]MCW3835813.1 division/cell wall cluster transcriptional repressor MraZ [Sphingomonas canadensis]
MSRDVFEGFALQSVEDKGRVAIPADLRATIERNCESRIVVIGLHESEPCLSAHDLAWSQEKHRRIDNPAAAPFTEAAGVGERAMQQAFGPVERASFDPSGRFILPPFFRAEAKIGKWAAFSGAGNTFNIWAPEMLMATTAPELARLRSYCAYLCQAKGIAL